MKKILVTATMFLTVSAQYLNAGTVIHYTHTAPPPYEIEPYVRNVDTVAFFQEPLRPYGNWLRHRRLGLIWQPAIGMTVQSWEPYCNDGQWVWTSRGWYWHSYYPWGWAAFHYGRWAHDEDLGWVWVPGTEWAPAWVCWHTADSYYGWAPMPPDYGAGASVTVTVTVQPRHYVYVPASRFTCRHIASYREYRRRAVRYEYTTAHPAKVTVPVPPAPAIPRVPVIVTAPVAPAPRRVTVVSRKPFIPLPPLFPTVSSSKHEEHAGRENRKPVAVRAKSAVKGLRIPMLPGLP